MNFLRASKDELISLRPQGNTLLHILRSSARMGIRSNLCRPKRTQSPAMLREPFWPDMLQSFTHILHLGIRSAARRRCRTVHCANIIQAQLGAQDKGTVLGVRASIVTTYPLGATSNSIIGKKAHLTESDRTAKFAPKLPIY